MTAMLIVWLAVSLMVNVIGWYSAYWWRRQFRASLAVGKATMKLLQETKWEKDRLRRLAGLDRCEPADEVLSAEIIGD